MNKFIFYCIFILLEFVGFGAWGEPLTLERAISEALQNSPKIQKSNSVYNESSWKKVESFSNFLPTLSASASYLLSKQYVYFDMSLAPGNPALSIPEIIPTSNFYLTAQMPLFDGWAGFNRFSAAKAMERAARDDLDWTKFQVQREVTLQFYKALAAKELVNVAKQNISVLQDHLHDIQLFRKAGISTKFDVLRVEVQVSEAKSELLNALDNVEISKEQLGKMLGHESESRNITGALPILNSDLLNSFSNESLSRADLSSLQQKTLALDDQEAAASVHWLPKIFLLGQYQYYNNRNDQISDFANYRDAYMVGVNLTWNLFDGMASFAKSKESIEQKYQLQKTLKMAELQAKQEVEVWMRKFKYFILVYKSRQDEVEKSAESVRLAKQGRKVGARTNTDLLDAESELYRAKAGVVNAQIGSIEALINLELNTGQKLASFE